MSTDHSLAAHQIKQKKLYKMQFLLFGCSKDYPQKVQSDDSLVCTPKSSEFVDVSSHMDRIPAGGTSPCSCPNTRDVSTQTGDNETGPEAVSTESVPGFKDAGTQSSFTDWQNNTRSAVIKVEYTKGLQPSGSHIVEQEEEPQADIGSISEKLSQKWGFRRPLIVVDGSLSRISGASTQRANNQKPQSTRPARGQPPRGQPPRGQPARGQQPKGQITKDNKNSKNQQKKRQPVVAFEPPPRNQPYPAERYETSSVRGAPSNQSMLSQYDGNKPTKQDAETQSEEQPGAAPSESKHYGTAAGSRIPEILCRVCELETKLKQQECCIKSLQCSLRTGKPSNCNFNQSPKGSGSPCKSKCNQSTQRSNCSIQGSINPCQSSSCCPNQKRNQEFPDSQTLKKEFIDIFMKSEPATANAVPKCSQKDMKKPISICPLQNNCEDPRKMYIQCLEKSGILMQQFNQMFVKPGSQGLNYNINELKNNTTLSLEQCSKKTDPGTEICEMKPEKDMLSCLSISTQQCLTDPESNQIENIVDKCVDLVATKSKDDVSNVVKVSSASLLAENSAPKPSDSRQSLQKEAYEFLLAQFIKYFTEPKTECEQNPPPAQNTEGEHYSFDRLFAELINLFSKTKNPELSVVQIEEKVKSVTTSTSNMVLEKAVQIEEKGKSVTTSTSNMVLEKDQKVGCQDKSISVQSVELIEKPSKVESICKDPPDPPVSNGGCQSCSDNGNLHVLDSLVDEMMKIIDCRPFRDVVLTIMRRGCNIYHINVRERATGKVLGCLLANVAAINEAISLGLFEDIHTFCEVNKQSAGDPRDCPLDAIVPQREPGGETQLAIRNKAKAMEFVTRVLGLSVGEAEGFVSLTNALKTAKESSDQNLIGTEISRVTENAGLIGRGAVTDNLIFLGSVHDAPEPSMSQSDMSELGEASKHFLRMLSGVDTEDKDKV